MQALPQRGSRALSLEAAFGSPFLWLLCGGGSDLLWGEKQLSGIGRTFVCVWVK